MSDFAWRALPEVTGALRSVAAAISEPSSADGLVGALNQINATGVEIRDALRQIAQEVRCKNCDGGTCRTCEMPWEKELDA